MIFRAIFWIGLVALLMPHEPDLGLGRPGASMHANLPGQVSAVSLLERFQTAARRNLELVRADIEAHRQVPPHGI